MNYIVSITSQVQISIPAALLKRYGFDQTRKAVVYSKDDGKLIIEPITDFLSLKGALKGRKIDFKKVRKEFESYLAARHLRKK